MKGLRYIVASMIMTVKSVVQNARRHIKSGPFLFSAVQVLRETSIPRVVPAEPSLTEAVCLIRFILKRREMPLYDYQCNDCGNTTEIFVRNSVNETLKCAKCGSKSMEKLFSSSYLIKMGTPSTPECTTCCERTDRCDTSSCSADSPYCSK